MVLNKFRFLIIMACFFLTVTFHILLNIIFYFFRFLLQWNWSFIRTNGRWIVNFNLNIHIELLQFIVFFLFICRWSWILLQSHFLIKFILTFLHQLFGWFIIFWFFKALLLFVVIGLIHQRLLAVQLFMNIWRSLILLRCTCLVVWQVLIFTSFKTVFRYKNTIHSFRG